MGARSATRCAGSGSPTTSSGGVEQEAPTVGAPGALVQIPQDTGSRGVAGRDRDAVLASFAAEAFPNAPLQVELEPDDAYTVAEVRVLNGVGDAVSTSVEAKTGGRPVRDRAPPGTYALRAAAETFAEGQTEQPVELYRDDVTASIRLDPQGAAPAADGEAFKASEAPVHDAPPTKGHVKATARDPLALVEVRDNTGAVTAAGLGVVDVELDPGFYGARVGSPEADGETRKIALAPGEQEPSKAPTRRRSTPVPAGSPRRTAAASRRTEPSSSPTASPRSPRRFGRPSSRSRPKRRCTATRSASRSG